jgi:hypothetical protein
VNHIGFARKVIKDVIIVSHMKLLFDAPSTSKSSNYPKPYNACCDLSWHMSEGVWDILNQEMLHKVVGEICPVSGILAALRSWRALPE